VSDDLSGFSMQDLFRIETENQTALLTEGLLQIERDPQAADALESLMRAAHSIKGAARIINLDAAVRVAHQMEDCFVAAQAGKIVLGGAAIDVLLRGIDMLSCISNIQEAESEQWFSEHEVEIDNLVGELSSVLTALPNDKTSDDTAVDSMSRVDEPEADGRQIIEEVSKAGEGQQQETSDRVLRLSSEHLDRMLALASEMQVSWRWLEPFADSMLHLKRHLVDLERMLGDVDVSLHENRRGSDWADRLKDIRLKVKKCHETVAEQQIKLDSHSIMVSALSHRLYHQTVEARMRPFSDAVPGLRRMVRDLARDLGKQARLEIDGLDTMVDRDILEKIKAPLDHLIRNAIDHGIELPEERECCGKPEEGVVRVEARHQSGMLQITVADDGRGLDLDALRQKVVRRELASKDMVARMAEAELMAFLFLPGFSMKENVTEISGRGVGLDVVANMVRDVRGTIHSSVCPDGGMHFELRLPITLSVIRALLVDIGDEPYAFPLVHVESTLKCKADDIEYLEGRQYIHLDGQPIGLVSARDVFGLPLEEQAANDDCSVVVLGPPESRYGLIVDRFLGEYELVEKVLNARLGKVQDISSAAVMDDGTPLLIFDVNDLLHSIAKQIDVGKLGRARRQNTTLQRGVIKRILVVDDSITVREVERKLLVARGYEVDVAVDGVDGLNSMHAARYDLLISDVDMPRMDGIELVRQVKGESRFRDLPVVIVSYKESDEDRMRGLEAGADAYLSKGSFHDETLINTVVDLIGEAN